MSQEIRLPPELYALGNPPHPDSIVQLLWQPQPPGVVFAGPIAGPAARPEFRPLTASDLALDLTAYALLAGRAGTTNDLTLTTTGGGIGTVYGGTSNTAQLTLRANSGTGGAPVNVKASDLIVQGYTNGAPGRLSISTAVNDGGFETRFTPQVQVDDIDYFLPAADAAGVLTSNGAGWLSWGTVTGTGTVTSVAATAPAAGFTITGSAITTSGTLVFTLANDLAALEGLTTTGLASRTADGTWTTTSGTVTQVMLWDTGGLIPTSSANLTFASGVVSIIGGTQPLYMRSSTTAVGARFDAFSATAGSESSLTLMRTRGTAGAAANILNGDAIASVYFSGADDQNLSPLLPQNGFTISATATENWTSGQNGTLVVFKSVRTTANAPGTERMRFNGDGSVEFPNDALVLDELSATPADPTSGTQTKVYMKADKFILQFNDGGTVRYKYLDLTGTGVTWTHTTTPP